MANLIITIISIGLVAVAAIMAIYYGGQAFQNGQINALAAAMVTEAQQTLVAQRLWATNNNQPDATGAVFTTLVTSKDLITRPYGIAAQLGMASSALVSGNAIGNAYPTDCVTYNGYGAGFHQELFTYNGNNYVFYGFRVICVGSVAYGVSDADASQANNPFVQLAKAVNSNLGFVPTANNVMTASGIPRLAASGSALSYTATGAWFLFTNWPLFIMLDGNGNVQTNYCYYPYTSSTTFQYLSCVFGPS